MKETCGQHPASYRCNAGWAGPTIRHSSYWICGSGLGLLSAQSRSRAEVALLVLIICIPTLPITIKSAAVCYNDNNPNTPPFIRTETYIRNNNTSGREITVALHTGSSLLCIIFINVKRTIPGGAGAVCGLVEEYYPGFTLCCHGGHHSRQQRHRRREGRVSLLEDDDWNIWMKR